jgi:GNAT superfamily N-acetyltransferase
MPALPVHTAPLCLHRELAPTVAAWLLAEWPGWYGPSGEGALASDVAAFAASAQHLPVGLLAFCNGQAVGFCALKAHSIPSHAHLGPWAAAGVVLPAQRGQGLGAAMLRGLVVHAHALGHAKVYCGTSTAVSLLQREGWVEIETTTHAGQPLSIFCVETAQAAGFSANA